MALIPAEYPALLTRLRELIQQAQHEAALALNTRLVDLYWHIGREILAQQNQQGWGAKVIDQLALDLVRAFSESKGFSTPEFKVYAGVRGGVARGGNCATAAAQLAVGP